jgi:hypothetical protein
MRAAAEKVALGSGGSAAKAELHFNGRTTDATRTARHGSPHDRVAQLAVLLNNSPRTQQLARIRRAANSGTRAMPVVQRVPIKLDAGTYHPATHATGTVVESDELAKGERKQAVVDLNGTPTLTAVQQGWRAAAQNVDPVVTAMVSDKLSDTGTKARATRLYRASQNAGGTVSALLEAQQEWQDFLKDTGVSKEAVLSTHRSFGLEYEFATWELINPRGVPVKSHTEVGKSNDFSAFFGVPFVLETDAQQELELVAPPLLAGDAAGGVNTVFMKAAHQLLLAKLVQIRSENINTRADQLPFENEGFGSNWHWIDAARLVQVAAVRQKWATTANQVGYQLNVALTPAEIAAEIARVQDNALNNDHGTLFKTIRNRFLNSAAYRNLPTAARKRAVDPAIVILAKGLSNSIAIPTLTLVAETHTPWPRNDLHSYVKDLHGIWIKDSVPNAAVAAVQGQPQALNDFTAIVDAVRSGQDLIPRDVLTSIPPYTPQGAASTEQVTALLERLDVAERGSTALKKAAEDEAKACLTEVRNRLGQYNPQPQANPKPNFLEETFGGGSGVRKDTYANIGRSRRSTMHLAEFRSVASTNAFLR